MHRKEKLRNYLEWLITPQTTEEKQRFRPVIDDYIQLKKRIPNLSEQELVSEINIQLKEYGLKTT